MHEQTAAQTAEFGSVQLLTWERPLWVDADTEKAQTVSDIKVIRVKTTTYQ